MSATSSTTATSYEVVTLRSLPLTRTSALHALCRELSLLNYVAFVVVFASVFSILSGLQIINDSDSPSESAAQPLASSAHIPAVLWNLGENEQEQGHGDGKDGGLGSLVSGGGPCELRVVVDNHNAQVAPAPGTVDAPATAPLLLAREIEATLAQQNQVKQSSPSREKSTPEAEPVVRLGLDIAVRIIAEDEHPPEVAQNPIADEHECVYTLKVVTTAGVEDRDTAEGAEEQEQDREAVASHRSTPRLSFDHAYRAEASLWVSGATLRGESESVRQRLAERVVQKLAQTWKWTSSGGRTATFGVDPYYVLQFLFLNPTDGDARVLAPSSEDIDRRILAPLRVLFDLDVEWQDVYGANLEVVRLEEVEGSTRRAAPEKELQKKVEADFLQEASTWTSEVVARGVHKLPQLKRLATAAPEAEGDEQGHGHGGASWGSSTIISVASWGVLALSNDPLRCWIRHLRSSFGLEKDHPPTEVELLGVDVDQVEDPSRGTTSSGSHLKPTGADGREPVFTAAELLHLQRHYRRVFLDQIRKQVRTASEMTHVPREIQQKIDLAGSTMETLLVDVEKKSLIGLRKVLFLLNEGVHDAKMVPELYFSFEFTTAVFLPVVLPALVPLLTFVKVQRENRNKR